MKRYVNKIAVTIFLLLVLALAVSLAVGNRPSARRADKRVREFAELVNYHADEPDKIYDYLTQDYRNSISREDFITAFEKERSYPYLTPFFINLTSIKMDKSNRSGVAFFSQAARLPGMEYEMPFIYENGNYYMDMEKYNGFPDGSYLDKFDNIPNYITEGW